MPRLKFGDFLALDNDTFPPRGRGRGRGGFRGGSGGRGRGRGGIGAGASFGGAGRGGRGGHVLGGAPRGRGGRGGRGGMRGGHFGADYTNVPLDYGRVNTTRYTRADQYLNAEPSAQENAANPETPRRNKGKARAFAPHGTPGVSTPDASTANSGTATPVTSGLRFHRSRPAVKATRVDKAGVVYWGGGLAPLFVKAGELFRDGEVDVVKRDGDRLIIETYPMSDPSAPQMDDLRDDTEMTVDSDNRDIILKAIERAHQMGEDHHEETVLHWKDLVGEEASEDEDVFAVGETSGHASAVVAVFPQVTFPATAPTFPTTAPILDSTHVVETETEIATVTPVLVGPPTALSEETPEANLVVADVSPVSVEDSSLIVEAALPESTKSPVEAARESPNSDDDIDEDEFTKVADDALFVIDTTGDDTFTDDALFFVDTDPTQPTDSTPIYDGPSTVALGDDRHDTVEVKDESIIFRPRIIADPVATAGLSSASRRPPATNFELTNIYVDPRVKLSRKDRKAAKKAKRARNKRGKHRGNGGYDVFPREGDSDLDWGSDGPPGKAAMDEDMGSDSEMDALGKSLAGTDLDLELGREADVDPDIDIEAMARFSQSMSFGRGGDAMVEMETDSDEWEDKGRPKKFSPSDPWGDAGGSDEDESDESEDDDLDETADFAALAAAYESEGDDSDSDDEDESKLFAGHQAWKDDEEDEGEDEEEDEEDEEEDDDWFLQRMEAALDGGVMSADRKDRKAVFRSIEKGTFDDLALPTAPIKKSKKGKHVPEALHAQWERDRQKKAEKKQARELERVLGLLGSGGGKKGKKGKNRMAEAAAIAHLIPRSAAEVAELFDIDSDEDGDDGGWKVTALAKRGRNPLLPKTLEEIDDEIRVFLADPKRTSLPLPAMDKEARKKVHMLAECYDLKSKSKGKGAARFPVLIKLARSGLKNEDKVEKLLSASMYTGGAFYKALYMRKKRDKGDGSGRGAGFVRGTGASARAREGELVGEGAEKIGIDNIGHKLLSRMGWSEGTSIGREGIGGLDNPIVAVVKNTKMGLGA